MLDRPEKVEALLEAMEEALPFKVRLLPELVDMLAQQENPVAAKSVEVVTEVSYAGDDGGIVCHIDLSDANSMVVVSLMYVRVPHDMPFAAAALAYQKHRSKKLRKQYGQKY